MRAAPSSWGGNPAAWGPRGPALRSPKPPSGRGALGAGPGNPAPALEAGPSRVGVGWPPAPWQPSNVTAAPRRGLGSPAGQGRLCADAADPCFRAANPFRLTARAGWSQAAWEPGVGLGVRWGAFGQEAPIRDHLLPNRGYFTPSR